MQRTGQSIVGLCFLRQWQVLSGHARTEMSEGVWSPSLLAWHLATPKSVSRSVYYVKRIRDALCSCVCVPWPMEEGRLAPPSINHFSDAAAEGYRSH